MSASLLRSLTCSLSLAASAGVLVLSGCGLGSPAAAPDSVVGSVAGHVFGGSAAIVGATVTLYATQSNGYGGTGVQLGNTATTDGNGYFTFVNTTPYSCPSGQQAYVTVSGGNPGAGQNDQELLMAAIGDCSKLATGTRANVVLFVNELSTVAAAYALNNFISISGTTIDISAPGNANSTTGSCAVTGTKVTTSCTTASLAHAFANALNLVNSVGTTSAIPNGAAYTVAPSNSNSTVPQALLNTLADALVACVNSQSVTGSLSGTCSTLMTAATPPGGTAPTNTLQAMMNIARYPSQNVAAIYALTPASSVAYQPVLSAAPHDFAVAIAYFGEGSGAAFTYPYYLTLDINDTVYSVNQTGSSAGTPTVTSLASNGTPGFTGAGVTAAKCTAGSACLLSTDTIGNIWLPNTNGTGAPNIYKVSATDGTLTATYSLTSTDAPNGSAVNSNNTVYITSAATANPNVLQLAAADTTFSAVQTTTGTSTTALTESVAPEAIAVDSALSLWNVNYTSSSTGATYVPNTNTTLTTAPTFGTPVAGTTTATAGPYSILIDGSNNGWVNSTTTLYKFTPGSNAPSVSAPIKTSDSTPVTASSARYGTLDGVGNIFLPQNSTTASYLFEYVPATGVFYAVNPCRAPAGATTCGSTASAAGSPALYGSRNAQVDSTGAIWVTSSTNGALVQVLGLGAPTWPQLSYAHPGVKPQ